MKVSTLLNILIVFKFFVCIILFHSSLIWLFAKLFHSVLFYIIVYYSHYLLVNILLEKKSKIKYDDPLYSTGNSVSWIQSVFHPFGSNWVAKGTGILFNNRMTGFSLEEKSPNFIASGKRPAHTLNAWIITVN